MNPDSLEPNREAAPDSTSFPRVSTGNANADLILDGGFMANSINIIMGEPGTGKTVFAQQLMFHNASDDRPVLYLTTLSEPLPKVVSYAQRLAFFDAARLNSAIVYDDVGPALAAEGPRALVSRLAHEIRTTSPRIIMIDSFRAIHDLGADTAETRRLISDLAGMLSAYDATTFFLGEYTRSGIQLYPEFAVADSIVELARVSLGSRDERFFRVLKLRGESTVRDSTHSASRTGGWSSTRAWCRLPSRRITRRRWSAWQLVSRGSTTSLVEDFGEVPRRWWSDPPARAKRLSGCNSQWVGSSAANRR